MSARTRVAVIGGGRNGEHEVSLASAASVAGALDPERYAVVALTIDRDGSWLDAGGVPLGLSAAVTCLATCDVVFPVLHGPRGEDGTLAALCELADVAYVGSGVRAGAVAMDKWVTKLVARAVGIAVAPGALLNARSAASYRWRRPVVVKPVAAGSSLGVTLVGRPADLPAALAGAFAHDDQVLVEHQVIGREIDLAVLRRADGTTHLSPALEVEVDDFFDFSSKYDGGARFTVPPLLDHSAAERLGDAAVTMYDALGCRGVARVDFFLTDDGPVLNEVNTMPGFTAHSQVPTMYAAAGLAYPDLLDTLVQDALALHRGRTLTAVG